MKISRKEIKKIVSEEYSKVIKEFNADEWEIELFLEKSLRFLVSNIERIEKLDPESQTLPFMLIAKENLESALETLN